MSTGQKFRHAGLSVGDRMKVLRKERELVALEVAGHKSMVERLLKVLGTKVLTSAQARAVAEEISWRRAALADARDLRKRKSDSISNLKATQERVQQRMRYVAHDNERKAA